MFRSQGPPGGQASSPVTGESICRAGQGSQGVRPQGGFVSIIPASCGGPTAIARRAKTSARSHVHTTMAAKDSDALTEGYRKRFPDVKETSSSCR